jgi:hypothetical protein
MKKEAERIRAEVASFEKQKKDVLRKEERRQEQIKSEKLEQRMRYSTEVPILKSDGSTAVERVDFPPRIKDGKYVLLIQRPALSIDISTHISLYVPFVVCRDFLDRSMYGHAATWNNLGRE